VVNNSRNYHVHSKVHKALKLEEGEPLDVDLRPPCKKPKSTKVVKKNLKRARDYESSDESEESDSDAVETSSEESESVDEIVEDSEDEESELSDEDKPAPRLSGKKFKSSTKPAKFKDSEDEESESSDEDEPAPRLSGKSSKHIRKPAKVKQARKSKSKAQPTLRASLTVLNQRDTDLISKLPAGTRVKPVAFCSIARGYAKKKLPALCPVRKYTFFSEYKPIKVH
jgi:hypothetical protein